MKQCFIVSPIGEANSAIRSRSDEILTHIIRPALNEFDYEAIRADEISDFGLITNQVIEHIIYDDLVIADMTFKNPNVYYEVAIRHFVQKPIIQIIEENEDLSFDLVNTRTIKISRSLSGAEKARGKIKDYLKRIASGNIKVETPISNVVNFDAAILDKSPLSRLSRTLPDVIDLLKATKDELNEARIQNTKYTEDADRLKAAFLANISHEIRTPVNAIIGFSKMIGSPEFDNDEKAKFIEIVISNGRSLLSLLNNIISLSKLDSNNIEVNKSPFKINDMMTVLYREFSFDIEGDKNIRLKVNCENSNPRFLINTDPKLLEFVLHELIGNSLKFTHLGEIEFGYKLKDSNHIHFFVRDTGIGISETEIKQIFDQFHQLNNKAIRSYEGLGIGLTIAQKYVEILGGELKVVSKLEKGSIFSFDIPLS